MLRQYETTFIVDAHLQGEEVDAAIDKMGKFIESKGGKIKSIDRWGKRRLAYEIAKKQYGYYVCVRYEAEGSFIRELEREFKLDGSILRYLTVLITKAALKQEMLNESKAAEESPKEAPEDLKKPEKFSPVEVDSVIPDENMEKSE